MGTERFKNILKDLRIEKGVKQKDVAIACDVSPQCISQLELGARNPTGSTLAALADYFNCSVDYLLGRTDDYTSDRSVSPMPFEPSMQETELVAVFRHLPKDLKKHLLDYSKKLAKLYGEQVTPANR